MSLNASYVYYVTVYQNVYLFMWNSFFFFTSGIIFKDFKKFLLGGFMVDRMYSRLTILVSGCSTGDPRRAIRRIFCPYGARLVLGTTVVLLWAIVLWQYSV